MDLTRFWIACLLIAATCADLFADPGSITTSTIAEAEKLIGLEFTDQKRELLLDSAKSRLSDYEANRKVEIPYTTFPAVLFNPLPIGFEIPREHKEPKWSALPKVKRPAHLEDAAFYSVTELAALIKSRQVTSVELTEMYLGRLKRFGPKLECVVTLTEGLALEQARRADREIAAGKYKGLLHGIPYGAKDLLSTKGIKTTWGSVPYKDQVFDEDATVIKKLQEAGAVLVAKTTMGELAWGEFWFGGMTRNPWNPEKGSSGSSAGSAAGVSAGLFPFAIGSETHGSIISPAATCGVTGLRPTYGRVSRIGCMSLSWTMDKIGPIARTVEDCAIVLHAISGPDGVDPTLFDAPFKYQPKVNLKKLRIGYLKNDFEKKKNNSFDLASLKKLEELGAKLIPIELPTNIPASTISFVLSTEGAAFFDELTRSNRDDLMVRQIANAWPNVFRARRFVTAVEYLQAQRIRTLLIQEMHKFMQQVDVYVAPWDTGSNLLMNNLTGHPAVVVPNGFTESGLPTAITFVGGLFGEADLLGVAKAYQDATGFHRKYPNLETITAAK
jgi:Asp-tRNA(Asn)/Glu-tRNA(Gln) amidotransferase A subunit family amidase